LGRNDVQLEVVIATNHFVVVPTTLPPPQSIAGDTWMLLYAVSDGGSY